MSYHLSQEKTLSRIKAVFQKPVNDEQHYNQAYHLNGFVKPNLYLPVISIIDPGHINMYRWRLIPGDKKDDDAFKANTLNARNHELYTTPSYQRYWENRCLVICTGFFEPHNAFGYPKSQSWYIKPKQDEFMTLGAIFSKWNNIYTVSIITTDTNSRLEQIHNDGKRMPLILDTDKAQAWLQPGLTQNQMTELMIPYPNQHKLTDYRVLDGVTDWTKDTNVAEILEPFDGIIPGAQLPMFAGI